MVGAVALMISSNNFCKLPVQDGDRAATERGLASADDIVYWTDNTYSIDEVLSMEARLLQGFEADLFESPIRHLSLACALQPLPEATLSVATELLLLCAREYGLLQLEPALVAACCLDLALRNAPDSTHAWDQRYAAGCGFGAAELKEVASNHLGFCRGAEVSCRLNSSGSSVKTITVTLLNWPGDA